MNRLSAEVIVIGGGPAGSALSAALAGRGRDVLLVDRAHFPRPKACGECLNPGAVAVLRRLELLDAVLATKCIPLSGWELTTPLGRAAWLGFPRGCHGLGVDRATLDAALVDEARRRGVRLVEGLHVHAVDPGSDRRAPQATGRLRGGKTVNLQSAILVGADGLRSVVAREIGALGRPPTLRKASLTWRIVARGPTRDRGRLFLGGERTVGLAPTPGTVGSGDGWNATLVVASRRFGPHLRREGWSLLLDGLARLDDSWEGSVRKVAGPWGSGAFDQPVRRAVTGRTLLVGDAAGYYDPLTGQGIFRALRSAELAAMVIDEALPPRGIDTPSALPKSRAFGDLSPYEVRLARAMRPGRGVQRVVESVVSHPGLREPALAALARSPQASRWLARLTGDFLFDEVPSIDP